MAVLQQALQWSTPEKESWRRARDRWICGHSVGLGWIELHKFDAIVTFLFNRYPLLIPCVYTSPILIFLVCPWEYVE